MIFFFEGGDISLEKKIKKIVFFIIDGIVLKNIVLYSRITEVSTYSIVTKCIKV